MADVPNFNVIPKDIDGVLIYLDHIYGKVQDLENSHAEVKILVNKIEKKMIAVIIAVVVAIGAKYGLDLTGIS